MRNKIKWFIFGRSENLSLKKCEYIPTIYKKYRRKQYKLCLKDFVFFSFADIWNQGSPHISDIYYSYVNFY